MYKPRASRGQIRIERFTFGLIHMMMLLLFLFTNYVKEENFQTIAGYVYIGGIALLFLVNIGFILINAIDNCMVQRKLKKK